jgi:hypothetical protein
MLTRTYDRARPLALLVPLALSALSALLALSALTPPAHAAASTGKAAKMAGSASCPRRSVCLYSDANFQGKRIRYNCSGWARGSYRSADDAVFARNFPWNRDGGVSSYVNNGVPSAKLQTATPEGGYGQPPLPKNSRDNLGPSNDLVTDLYLIC